MSSLAASQLLIEHLRIFNDFDHHQRCSLACSAIETTLDSIRANPSLLRALSHLSLSFSDTESSLHLAGPRKLLELCPRLTRLELHQFCVGLQNLPETKVFPRRPVRESPFEFAPNAQANIARLFQEASHAEPMPRLEFVRLDGVQTSGEDLLRFVMRAAPRQIGLVHVTLAEGESFSSMFEYCCSTSAGVEQLDLRDLREGERPVIFDESGTMSLQKSGRSGVRLEPIKYHVPALYERQGGPQEQERRRRERFLYGPL